MNLIARIAPFIAAAFVICGVLALVSVAQSGYLTAPYAVATSGAGR